MVTLSNFYCYFTLLCHGWPDPESLEAQGPGLEPLHVSMPRELKSRPSTSPTHPGRMLAASNLVTLTTEQAGKKLDSCVFGVGLPGATWCDWRVAFGDSVDTAFDMLCKVMPGLHCRRPCGAVPGGSIGN